MTLTKPNIVSQEQWLTAQREHLKFEKELTRLSDEVAARRRQLPWTKVEKPYTFEGPAGRQSLADLFAGRSQLCIYHFMLGPTWPEGCPSCSMVADAFNGTPIHLAGRDVTFSAVSRAPLTHIEAFKRRMGWDFDWVSSLGSDFNFDFEVSFAKGELNGPKVYNFQTSDFPAEEAPGLSMFAKDDAGDVYRTYSTFGRGLDQLLLQYWFLDRVPKGRDEDALQFPMAWVRHHDRYGEPEKRQACGCK